MHVIRKINTKHNVRMAHNDIYVRVHLHSFLVTLILPPLSCARCNGISVVADESDSSGGSGQRGGGGMQRTEMTYSGGEEEKRRIIWAAVIVVVAG